MTTQYNTNKYYSGENYLNANSGERVYQPQDIPSINNLSGSQERVSKIPRHGEKVASLVYNPPVSIMNSTGTSNFTEITGNLHADITFLKPNPGNIDATEYVQNDDDFILSREFIRNSQADFSNTFASHQEAAVFYYNMVSDPTKIGNYIQANKDGSTFQGLYTNPLTVFEYKQETIGDLFVKYVSGDSNYPFYYAKVSTLKIYYNGIIIQKFEITVGSDLYLLHGGVLVTYGVFSTNDSSPGWIAPSPPDAQTSGPFSSFVDSQGIDKTVFSLPNNLIYATAPGNLNINSSFNVSISGSFAGTITPFNKSSNFGQTQITNPITCADQHIILDPPNQSFGETFGILIPDQNRREKITHGDELLDITNLPNVIIHAARYITESSGESLVVNSILPHVLTGSNHLKDALPVKIIVDNAIVYLKEGCFSLNITGLNCVLVISANAKLSNITVSSNDNTRVYDQCFGYDSFIYGVFSNVFYFDFNTNGINLNTKTPSNTYNLTVIPAVESRTGLILKTHKRNNFPALQDRTRFKLTNSFDPIEWKTYLKSQIQYQYGCTPTDYTSTTLQNTIFFSRDSNLIPVHLTNQLETDWQTNMEFSTEAAGFNFYKEVMFRTAPSGDGKYTFAEQGKYIGLDNAGEFVSFDSVTPAASKLEIFSAGGTDAASFNIGYDVNSDPYRIFDPSAQPTNPLFISGAGKSYVRFAPKKGYVSATTGTSYIKSVQGTEISDLYCDYEIVNGILTVRNRFPSKMRAFVLSVTVSGTDTGYHTFNTAENYKPGDIEIIYKNSDYVNFVISDSNYNEDRLITLKSGSNITIGGFVYSYINSVLTKDSVAITYVTGTSNDVIFNLVVIFPPIGPWVSTAEVNTSYLTNKRLEFVETNILNGTALEKKLSYTLEHSTWMNDFPIGVEPLYIDPILHGFISNKKTSADTPPFFLELMPGSISSNFYKKNPITNPVTILFGSTNNVIFPVIRTDTTLSYNSDDHDLKRMNDNAILVNSEHFFIRTLGGKRILLSLWTSLDNYVYSDAGYRYHIQPDTNSSVSENDNPELSEQENFTDVFREIARVVNSNAPNPYAFSIVVVELATREVNKGTALAVLNLITIPEFGSFGNTGVA